MGEAARNPVEVRNAARGRQGRSQTAVCPRAGNRSARGSTSDGPRPGPKVMHMSAKIDWDKTIKRERKLRGRIEQAKTDKEARYWQTLYVGSRDPLRVAARRARSSFPLDRRPPLSAISETADR